MKYTGIPLIYEKTESETSTETGRGVRIGFLESHLKGKFSGALVGLIESYDEDSSNPYGNRVRDFRGLSMGGVLSGYGGYFRGLNVAGLIANLGNIEGVNIGGIAALADSVKGVNIGGLVSSSDSVRGLNATGAIADIDYLRGINISGIASFTKDITGLSIANFINVQTKNFGGLSIAPINYAFSSKKFAVQVGVYNRVAECPEDSTVIQIGLYNDIEHQIIPFVNAKGLKNIFKRKSKKVEGGER